MNEQTPKNSATLIWLVIGFVVLIAWFATNALWYIGSVRAPTLEAAARASLRAFGQEGDTELVFVDNGADPNDERVRAVVFKAKNGDVRYRLKVRQLSFSRWAIPEYHKVEE